ncbi:Cyclin [Sergentomyia squamirostris]
MLGKKHTTKASEKENDRINSKLLVKNDPPAKAARGPVLGEVGNRVLRSTLTNAKEGKLPDFKNVKPRVNTFWKKSELPGKKASIPEEVKKLTDATKVQPKSTVTQPSIKPINAVAPLAAHESDFFDSEEITTENTNSHSNELIEGVVNIDKNTSDNLMNMTEYVNDVYDYLFQLEKRFQIKQNYLDTHKDITPRMRKILIEWINEVHFQFHLETETYHMSVALIDRYLQVSKNISRKMLQLVGITALFVASKYEEVMPPSIHDFVHITDNSYTAAQVREMEQSVLLKLNFNMGRPLSIHFLRRFSRAALATDIIHGSAKYFMELASLEYSMVHLAPSLLAAASIYLSLRIFDEAPGSSVWTPTLVYYSKYHESDIQDLAKTLAILVVKAPTTNSCKSVYKKYKAQKNGKVSTMPEMSEGTIVEIADS